MRKSTIVALSLMSAWGAATSFALSKEGEPKDVQQFLKSAAQQPAPAAKSAPTAQPGSQKEATPNITFDKQLSPRMANELLAGINANRELVLKLDPSVNITFWSHQNPRNPTVSVGRKMFFLHEAGYWAAVAERSVWKPSTWLPQDANPDTMDILLTPFLDSPIIAV